MRVSGVKIYQTDKEFKNGKENQHIMDSLKMAERMDLENMLKKGSLNMRVILKMISSAIMGKQYFIKVGIAMRAYGKMGKLMEMEYINGKMDLFMKVISIMEFGMEWGSIKTHKV